MPTPRLPEQFTFPIDRPHEQRLDNFVVGDNTELVAHLRSIQRAFKGVWLFGDVGSGRSHLLRGRVRAAQRSGESVCYVGCADHAGVAPIAALQPALSFGRIVAVDDVGLLLGNLEAEEALLAIYQRLLQEEGELLLTHTATSQAESFALADLASRLRSLPHFFITPLGDAEKAELLRGRAASRGYTLTPEVLNYWLLRGPRDIGALLIDLEMLDRASLTARRTVTIPLLKQVLGY